MRTYRTSLPIVLGLALAISCVSVDTDPNETGDDFPNNTGPTIEFDPSNSIVPFPTNLLLNPTNGLVNLPEGCNEGPAAAALREQVLNSLNGFGTFKPAISATFTEAVSAESLAGNVKLYKRATAGVPVEPSAAVEIPLVIIPGQTGRDSADCTVTNVIENATFVPMVPLEGDSTYTVALTGNITTAMGGRAFDASSTWALIRGETNPVTFDDAGNIIADATPLDPFNDDDRQTLEGLNLLWNAHAGAMAFLAGTGLSRTDVHLAWEFNTQTTTRPLDPSVDGSLASNIGATPLLGVASVTGADTAEEFLITQLGAATCALLGCAAVGDVMAGALNAQSYQRLTANPLGGEAPMVPGSFPDPVAPEMVGTELVGAIAFVPATPPPSAAGYPVVIFGHGLTRSRGDILAIGSQLAGAGFASVAIDWVAHGSRAIQVSDDPMLGCADVSPGPSVLPQCFAPILSTDLSVTRDNIRQTTLNGLALIEALKGCGATNCPGLPLDTSRLGYIGQSLGSIIGTTIVSMSPDIRAAVLNVGGVGLVDVVENTDSIGIRCSIVNGLITAGVIAGEVNVTCLGDEWKADPGYRRFAVIGRWALDPSDGANFLAGLAGKAVLIQEVINDETVPNFATNQQAALMGLTAMEANAAVDLATTSDAILTAPNDSKFVTYATLPPDAGTGFPGNSYSHGSILAPVIDPDDPENPAGIIGTVLMQRDAITYLFLNTQ